MKRYAGSLAVFFVMLMLFAGNVARAEDGAKEQFEAAISFRNAQGELLSGKEIAIIIGRHWRKRSSFDRVQISSNYSFQLEEDSPRRLVIEFFIHPNHSFVNTQACLATVLDPAVQYQKITVLKISNEGKCAWASETLKNLFSKLDVWEILGTLH